MRYEMKVPRYVFMTVGTKVSVELPGEKGSAEVIQVDHEVIDGHRKVLVEVPACKGAPTYVGTLALVSLEQVLRAERNETRVVEA